MRAINNQRQISTGNVSTILKKGNVIWNIIRVYSIYLLCEVYAYVLKRYPVLTFFIVGMNFILICGLYPSFCALLSVAFSLSSCLLCSDILILIMLYCCSLVSFIIMETTLPMLWYSLKIRYRFVTMEQNSRICHHKETRCGVCQVDWNTPNSGTAPNNVSSTDKWSASERRHTNYTRRDTFSVGCYRGWATSSLDIISWFKINQNISTI